MTLFEEVKDMDTVMLSNWNIVRELAKLACIRNSEIFGKSEIV